MPVVDIPNVGRVQFPDGMTPEQMTQAIETEILPQFQRQERPPATALDRTNAAASGVNSGVAGLAGIPVDFMQNVIDLGKAGAGYAYSEMTGKPVPSALEVDSDRRGVVGSGDWFRERLGSAAENPRPDDTASRYLHAAGMGASAALMPQAAPATIPNIVRAGVAGVSGANAAQYAAENDAGPTGQLIAGTAGALAPGAARAGAASAVRGLVRGGEAGRQRMEQNIQTFEDAGTTPSVGQAAQNRRMQATESLLSRTPGAAGVMANKGEALARDIGTRIDDLAGRLSSAASGEEAGRAITRGITGEKGFAETFKAKGSELYDQLDRSIPRQTRIELTNTAETLARLNAGIEGAPNLSRMFQNPKLRGIENALRADLDNPPPAQGALDQATAQRDSLLRSQASAMQDAGRFSAFANDQANRTNRWTPVPGQPRVTGRYSPFPERAAEGAEAAEEATKIARSRSAEARAAESVIADLEQLVSEQGGKLPYQAIKQLRTMVGNELADASPISDIPRSKWKSLYGALSADMEEAAKAAGPKAVQDLKRANAYYRAGMRRLEYIDAVIDRNGGPEAVYRAATAGTKEGATTIRAVMQSLPKDAQRSVSATVLRRLGRAASGSQDDIGSQFSTERFLTNWNNLSPASKGVLFDRYGSGFRQDMDQIAKVAANLRTGSRVYQNPSGTGQAVAQSSAAAGFVAAIVSGQPAVAAGIAGGVAGANVAARAMTNPTVVHWLAKTTRAPRSAVPALLAEAARSDDPDLAELAEFLRDQQAQ